MLTNRNWWETNTAHGILIILANIFIGCLIWYKSDLWIYWSAIYIYAGTWVYHFAVENKNSDIEYLTRRINQLERYAERLEEELENTRKI